MDLRLYFDGKLRTNTRDIGVDAAPSFVISAAFLGTRQVMICVRSGAASQLGSGICWRTEWGLTAYRKPSKVVMRIF
jgi:hypothetical protein